MTNVVAFLVRLTAFVTYVIDFAERPPFSRCEL